MMRFPQRNCSLIVSSALMLLAGCGSDDKPDNGVLVVPFELGNRRDCSSLGVATVRAELDDGQYSEETECGTGQVRFNLLKPGSYDITVYGLDDHGKAVMDSLADGPLPVDVVGGGTTVVFDPAVKLTAAPAKLMLRWDLGFGSCESTSIKSFGVGAWRGDGSDLLMETDVACEMAGEGVSQYRDVPDKQRDLSGDEFGEVEIQPYDMNGIAVGDPATFTFDSPGAGGKVKLSLACDEGGCNGSGKPD